MPVYDLTLRDFLQYVSSRDEQIKDDQSNSVFTPTVLFPLHERFQMTLRICDALIYMKTEISRTHRDVKLRTIFEI